MSFYAALSFKFFFPRFCTPYICSHPVPIDLSVVLVLHSLCQPGGAADSMPMPPSMHGESALLLYTRRGEILRPDIARGRITLFRPVPLPSIGRSGWPGGGSMDTRTTACFCEGINPRGHGENMQTPHRKALSPTPPRGGVKKMFF